jgi:alkylated DNA nucleotide flippase Atl1
MNTEDSIVQIAPRLERFFGCSGRMLKPCAATVAALVAQIPSGQVATTESLRRTLANRFGVEVTCPYDTKMALLEMSNDSSLNHVPLWRVVKANGELLPKIAGGFESQAGLLRTEGFVVDNSGKKPRIKAFKDKLFIFD